ncbi:MAG: hypothetical protein A2360_00345 [Candidatus Staskawiczbacteria bacterium RIFOXYB1_FULL_32_11]|uniref:Uncharacterized protein n=1 Tax=Candidatus Staskawiczbacteria bacterium RIFOXYD1_FULL_32_13 TaxID=1802234 RepID=A0A1G2JRF2_9BACT|nr:MAG: hypothetical protein A2360_00345 [Candidatus Staskawiczbacteria bacterium RIFOXYB1_FULL_32_11]OGZ89523.1 MAG: hypothetical protein A2561_01405 [Candidatus Staskawiczbacteria bacterium RIFOXYD1_FULL_32_13]
MALKRRKSHDDDFLGFGGIDIGSLVCDDFGVFVQAFTCTNPPESGGLQGIGEDCRGLGRTNL